MPLARRTGDAQAPFDPCRPTRPAGRVPPAARSRARRDRARTGEPAEWRARRPCGTGSPECHTATHRSARDRRSVRASDRHGRTRPAAPPLRLPDFRACAARTGPGDRDTGAYADLVARYRTGVAGLHTAHQTGVARPHVTYTHARP